MTNLETNYLSYPEAIKEALKPGYKSDWNVEEVENSSDSDSNPK